MKTPVHLLLSCLILSLPLCLLVGCDPSKEESAQHSDLLDIESLQQQAAQGNAQAQDELASCYETGKGVPQSYEKAAEWYQKAAEQSYAKFLLLTYLYV